MIIQPLLFPFIFNSWSFTLAAISLSMLDLFFSNLLVFNLMPSLVICCPLLSWIIPLSCLVSVLTIIFFYVCLQISFIGCKWHTVCSFKVIHFCWFNVPLTNNCSALLRISVLSSTKSNIYLYCVLFCMWYWLFTVHAIFLSDIPLFDTIV